MSLLSKIGTFGDVAAEDDDAVLSYFLETEAVDAIESGNCYAVIGRKGSGKTALTKYFSEPRKDYLSTAPTLRDYPWNLHAQWKNLGASDIESYVSSWRYLIAVKAMSVIIEQKGGRQLTDSQRAAREFLNENFGGLFPTLPDILKPSTLKVSKRIISPSIMGNSLGGIELVEEKGGGVTDKIDRVTEALIRTTQTLASQAGVEKVFLHIDELDQGLSTLDEKRKNMLIGLILAIRSIRSSKEGKFLHPVFYIRTDIWDEIRFSDKNKISQSSSVNLEWDAKTLLDLVNKRIKAKIGGKYSWDDLDDGSLMRGSQSKWKHIVSRTFHRPRDVIQFLNFALKNACKNDADAEEFSNEDISQARIPYSRYLKQELEDEIGPHWHRWPEALQSCSEIATMTFQKEQFAEAYDRRRSNDNPKGAEDALEALYGFSVIGYRRSKSGGGSSWVFQYGDPDAGWDSAATRLKVHAGLKEIAKLREERSNG